MDDDMMGEGGGSATRGEGTEGGRSKGKRIRKVAAEEGGREGKRKAASIGPWAISSVRVDPRVHV